MRLTAEQSIKLPINLPVYLVHGGEPLQIIEITNTIKTNLVKQGYNERIVFTVDNLFNWEQLLITQNNTNIFADKTLIELHLQQNKITKEGADTLIQFIESQKDDYRLLITADKLETSITKTKWFNLIDKIGCIITTKSIKTYQFPNWIANKFKTKGFIISPETINVLSQAYSGNTIALEQLLEKIELCYPVGNLNLEQIKPFINKDSHFQVFELIDAIIENNATKVREILESLQQDKVEPAIILWVITKEIRTMIKISYAIKANKSIKSACATHGILDFKIPKVSKFLKNTTIAHLENILQKIFNADLINKGIIPGLIWEELLEVGLMASIPSLMIYNLPNNIQQTNCYNTIR